MRKLQFCLVGMVAVLLLASTIFAAGVSLTGIGARATALGGSYRAISNDWSGMFWNPAGITDVASLQVGVSTELLWPVSEYAAAPYSQMNLIVAQQTSIENEAKTFVIPSGGVVYPISEKLTVGFGVWAPFGLGATWDILDTEDFNSQYPKLDYEDDLQVLDFHPTIAYKINDVVSIGAGFGLTYADIMIRKPSFIQNPYFGDEIYAMAGDSGPILEAGLDQMGALVDANNHLIAESELSGTGMGFSANLGVMFKVNKDLQIGISGRYYGDVSLDGDVNGTLYSPKNDMAHATITSQIKPLLDVALTAGQITKLQYAALVNAFSGGATPLYNDATAKASLPLPGDIGIGVAYKVINEEDRHLIFSADYQYTFWSAWDIIDIEIDGVAAASKLVEEWKNSYRASLGIEYKFNPMFALRGSYYYEKNAAVVKTLTPTIPDINPRNTFNLGFQFNITPDIALHGSYERIFVDDLDSYYWQYNDGNYDNMPGTYKMSVNNVMFGLEYNF